MNAEILISTEPIPYDKSFFFMKERVSGIINGAEKEMIWLLEHTPSITAGTSAKDSDLLDTKLPVFKTNRGGKHTHHAPGQRVVYLILDLKKRSNNNLPDPRLYVKTLENIIIDSLFSVGIVANIKEDMIGVWVHNQNTGSEEKIAAIGVRFSRGVAYHGFAVNISNDLNLFDTIIPCGIKDFKICSIQSLGFNVKIEDFDKILLTEIKKRFL